MKEIRLGYFYCTDELVFAPDFPEVLAFMEFVPLNVQFLPSHEFRYIGTSKLFRPVPEGVAALEYDILITTVNSSLSVDACQITRKGLH